MYTNIIIIYYVHLKIFTFLNILQLFELVLVECEIILMCVLKGNKVSIEKLEKHRDQSRIYIDLLRFINIDLYDLRS